MAEVALFSKHLGWLTVDQLGPVAAELGFTGVQLTVRPGGHVEPERVATDLPRAVRTLQLAGLTVSSVVTSLTRPEDPLTHTVLGTIAELGITRYRMGWYELPVAELQSPAGSRNPHSMSRRLRDALDSARQSLERFARLNEEAGLQGCYENHVGAGLAGASPWCLEELLRDLPPQWLGVEFDLRHAVIEGWSSWQPAFHLLRDRIGAVLVKDFTWEVEHTDAGTLSHLHPRDVPLGEGVAPFPTFLRLLHATGYDGLIVLHAEYPLSGTDAERRLEGSPGSVPGAPRDAFTRLAAGALVRDRETLEAWLRDAGLELSGPEEE